MQRRPGRRDERAAEMLVEAEKRGLKLTAQRIAILRAFACDDSHPTAQALYEKLKRRLPGMSFATVYNTLDALTAVGLCTPMSLSRGVGRFDPNTEPHHHAVCDRCGDISDVSFTRGESEPTEALRACAEMDPGFEIRAIEKVFRGICASCRSCS